MLAPVEAEPANVALDRVDVLDVLGRRVRIVEAEMTAAAPLARDPEVETDRFRVADVEVPVGLRRKSRDDASVVLAGRDILGDPLTYEVPRCARRIPFPCHCCSLLVGSFADRSGQLTVNRPECLAR